MMHDTLPKNDRAEYCCDGSDPDDIVITGMSGRFPWSDNVEELHEGLYSKKEFIKPTEIRWKKSILNLKGNKGAFINDLTKFDADFFGVSHEYAKAMDPSHRIFLEVVYETLVDAGYDPEDFRGKKIGIYCGISQYDTKDLILRNEEVNKIDLREYNGGLNPARAAFTFDFKGPCFAVDTACSSSAIAFACAFNDLKTGRVDAAVIGGIELCINAEIHANYVHCKISSDDGTIRPFDAKAHGMFRGETIVSVLVQKASEARRVYAKVLHSTMNSSGYLPDGLYVPSMTAQTIVYREALSKSGIDPLDIDYVEAHGTGTIVGDPIEVKSLHEVYCKDRKKPLLIGTVKSNIGHTEAAAAICGFVKSIFAFESGLICPNLYYETPNPKCDPLIDGSMAVVTEATPLTSECIAVSSFGFGGTNVHTILKRNVVEARSNDATTIPELVLCGATTREGVQYIIHRVMHSKLPRDFFVLLNNIAYASPLSKPYRGYALISDTHATNIELCFTAKREVWYVVTGLGCQWPGMGSQLMDIDIFAESIKRSAAVVKPLGINLLAIIKDDVKNFGRKSHITNTFVSICAIQIALIDVLRNLEIHPDGIIGHSIGELACAYADQCCTAEEAIKSAYYIAETIVSSKTTIGAMAVIEMTMEEAKAFCLKDLHISSHGPEGFLTISGPKTTLEKFVTKRKMENKFAAVIDTCGYGLHSPCVDSASSAMKSELQKVFTNPRRRSSRWLSTSYSPDCWSKEEANIINANYFANNLRSDIHFEEALKCVPTNAVIIEISPDVLLQSRMQHKPAVYVELMKRNENINFMLKTIGKLYCMGLNPKIGRLHPPPKYPVPRGTPSISNLIKWDHSTSFFVPKYFEDKCNVRLRLKIDTADSYLLDHCLDGKSLYPATGYISLVWKAFSVKKHNDPMELPVLIQDFKIHRATILSAKENKIFRIFISNVDGKFEISEGGSVVSSGRISSPEDMKIPLPNPLYKNLDTAQLLSGQELYSELKIRGYEYGPHFQGITEIAIDGSQGRIKWSDKWISYLDAHLLFFGIIHDKNFSLPVGARSIKINPLETLSYIRKQGSDSQGIPVRFDRDIQCCRSPGIEIRSLKAEVTQQRLTSKIRPILEECQFLAYNQEYAIPDDLKRSVIEYTKVCNVVANKVADSIGKTTGQNFPKCTPADICLEVVETYLNPKEPNKDHILLKFLNETASSESSSDNENNFFKNFISSIGNDVLYKTLFNEYTLRIILETIAENIQGKINVTELFNGCQPIMPLASDILKKFYNCKLNCTVFHPEPEFLDADIYKKGNIEIKILDSKENIQIPTQDIIISSFLFGGQEDVRSHINFLTSLVHNRSFILFYHKSSTSSAENFLSKLCKTSLQTVPQSHLENILQEFNLTIVAKKSDSLGSFLYLLRYDCNKISYADTVVNVLDGSYDVWVEQLKLAMSSLGDKEDGRVWLVADDSPENGIVGLVKCLKQEPEGDKIRCVYIFKDSKSGSPIPPFDLCNPFYSEILERDVLMNIYQDGTWGSFKHTKTLAEPKPKTVDHSCVQCTLYGDLSSFKWMESNVQFKWNLDEEEIVYVNYSSLNFRDVMIATGKLSISAIKDDFGDIPFCPLGFEFSGITSKGRRVMGMASCQCLATTIIESEAMVMDVPDDWSLEEAATVPVVYATSYFALITKGKLQYGESILIHSGTGGVGMAAIRIAMSMNCEIFVTVGTAEKREHLKKIFPQINDENIGCSRDTSFVDMIMNKTKGRGVDVVLNSLAEEKLLAGTRCLAEGGRFLEIGKYDLSIDNPIGMSVFEKGISFAGILLDQMFFHRWHLQLCEISELVLEGARKGVVKPLDRTVFAYNDVENAFRYMTTGKHMGKVIIKIQDEQPKGVALKPLELKVKPSLYFYGRKTYIIIGGLGGFGIELTKWILQNGAQNVIITSRYGARTAYHHLCLLRWKHSGKNVKVLTLDVSKRDEAKKLLEDVVAMGPVGGIFNSAVVLNDAFMENQNSKLFEEVCWPKATASKNLDELSRLMCPELDYFVCFSSISCGKGNAGQTSYGYANSVMERICEKRRREGLHGLAIQWGIIGDVGVVHRQIGEDAMIAGVVSQKITSCLATLEQFLLLDQAVLCSYVTVDVSAKGGTKQDDALSQLAKIFGFPSVSDMKLTRTFGEMGMDSMIGVELQHLLELNYDTSLSIKELQAMTVNDLQTLLQSKSETEQSTSETKQREKTATLKFSLPKLLIPKVAILPLNGKLEGTPVFFIHHSESELIRIQPLTRLLNCPAYGLPSTKETVMQNINTMAASYLKEIYEWCSECHLVGLSACSALAFESYLQSLSSQDNPCDVKSLTILVGSLHLANAFTGAWKTISADETEVSDLCDFLAQFSTSDLESVKAELSKKSSYESRQSYVVNLISSSCNEGAGSIADAVRRYKKVKELCRNYCPKPELKSDVAIIDTTATLLANDVSIVKSSFSKVCRGQVSISRIPGSENFWTEPEALGKIANLMNRSYQINEGN